MKNEQDYIQDIAEIRSMMERSSRFLSLSGWAGIMAGIYGLAGAYVAYSVLRFNPQEISPADYDASTTFLVVLLACAVLVLAIGTAIILSYRKAQKAGEKIWNATSRRLVSNMIIPLLAGGILCVILILQGLIGLILPMTLIFYGLAIYTASKFTFEDMKMLGIIQMTLGLIAAYYLGLGLVLWAIGFGMVHIIYGIYLHYRYER